MKPRGVCPVCDKTYALRKDGTMWWHRTVRGVNCKGSGKHGRIVEIQKP